MSKVQLITNCEGPLALNDNAFELCRDFIKPQGDRFFRQVSRYDYYLAEVAKKPGDQSGNILKLILPFLKAHSLTNAQIGTYSRQTIKLMPGAEGAYQFLRGRNLPIFELSTSYRQFANTVGLKLGFKPQHIFCTELGLDRFELAAAETAELLRLQEEITGATEIELPAGAASITDLPGAAQEAVATLDRIFGERLPAMEIGALLKEVNPFGGPEKAKAMADILAKTGLKMSEAIYVGDRVSDVQAFEAVRAGGGLAISFNGDSNAVNAAEVVLVSDSAWSIALLTAVFQSWGKEGVLEVAAPETRDKSRSLVLPEDTIDPIMTGLDGHMLNIYLSKGIDLAKIAQESLAMRAKLRGEAVAASG
jgi:predicted HAD superfamily phosphohydrolase